MAQTTGQISAKDVYISLDAHDISGSSNNVSIEPKRDIGKAGTFDGEYKLLGVGKAEWSGTIRALYTEVSDEAADVLWDAFEAGSLVTLIVAPKGNTPGNWTFTGSVAITEPPISLDGEKPDPVVLEAAFEGSGMVTRGTVATT